jgi:hypothetical protein
MYNLGDTIKIGKNGDPKLITGVKLDDKDDLAPFTFINYSTVPLTPKKDTVFSFVNDNTFDNLEIENVYYTKGLLLENDNIKNARKKFI